MKRQYFFLLVFSGVISFRTLCTARKEFPRLKQQSHSDTNGSTAEFLMCLGVPADPESLEQGILHLKGLTDALFDVLELMKSGWTGFPMGNMSAGMNANGTMLQDDHPNKVWLQSKLSPLLSSMSPDSLTCLSYNNFTCHTYQTVVWDLSRKFSSLDSQRQQWIYSHFMHPFLARNASAGCMHPNDTNEDWLMKNFGSFSVLATLRDFSSINRHFNGLDVLHLLSPEQKAELVLHPERAGLTNESHAVVLSSLINSLKHKANGTDGNAGYGQDSFAQAVKGLMTAFRPVGGFVREFVSFTHEQDLSSMRSATLIQAMLNWTLAELAAPYKKHNTSNEMKFDHTDFNWWYKHNVIPILNRYLITDIPDELSDVFHKVFYKKNSKKKPHDTCRLTLEGTSCAMTNVLEHTGRILQCAAKTNVTVTMETVPRLVMHLSWNLNTLLNQLAHMNFSSEDSPYKHVIERINEPEHASLTDEAFVTIWFHIQLKPLLPSVTPEYLQCLGSKPFSCQTFQTLVRWMSTSMTQLAENQTRRIYDNFIIPFLFQQRYTGACMGNSSLKWLMLNLGMFSQFGTVKELYLLNPGFDALEAVDALTLHQTAELIVEDLPQLPDKKHLVEFVLRNALTSPTKRQKLPQLVLLIGEKNLMKKNCMISREMFSRLHFASLSADPETEAVIQSSINNLIKATPAECVSYTGECNRNHINGSTICEGVNSSALFEYLNSPHNQSLLCNFTITQYACVQLIGLSTQDLATVLSCNLHNNDTIPMDTWTLFVRRVSPDIGPALDLLSNTTFPMSRPLVVLLDLIGDVTFSSLNASSFTNDSFIQLWFGKRLRPFLPYVSRRFLSCISKSNFSCETYQHVVKLLSEQFDSMSLETQVSVYVDFIYTFLTSNQTAGCIVGVNSSEWLKLNFGSFAGFALVGELQNLNPTLSVVEVVDSLSLPQLAELATSPGIINTSAQVTQVLKNIEEAEFGQFYTKLSAALMVEGVSVSPVVRHAFLAEALDRVNLSDPKVSDSEAEEWINVRLTPLISSIQASQIPSYFTIITQRSCNISQQGVAALNSTHSSFDPEVLQTINNQLITSLKDPELMNCYNNRSYYAFVQSYFMGFQFPNLSTYLSLIPPHRLPELLNSMSPAELSEFLNREGTVDNKTQLCTLFSIYNQTEKYLQSEPVLSSDVATQTLECVWPLALSASSQADVDRWFGVTLVQYLPYLNSQIINSNLTGGASCLAFSKFVSVMESYNFEQADFARKDIYTIIQGYLTTATPPKCFNSADPTLNSTAWFQQYIGTFITFITVDDLQHFGGTKLEQFTQNAQNLELLTKNNVSQEVTNVYIDILYDAYPDFSATALPNELRCSAPATAFVSLSQDDVLNISKSLEQQCTNVDSTVSAALASNVKSLTPESISALGNSITGLSPGQIAATSPSTLQASLNSLSSLDGWSQSQATTIIQPIVSSGLIQINTAESLVNLGSLVKGVPSSAFQDIPGNTLLNALQSQTFQTNILSTPTTTQQIIVNQIINVNSNLDTVVQKIPDSLAPMIPRTSLISLSNPSATILNQKQWTQSQAVLFFDVVAEAFPNADNISFQVLQGFTCTRARRFSKVRVKNLIRGCRRRGREKVRLVETQLTCMYNFIKEDNVTVFTDYPADMLLYYNPSLLQTSLCQKYYSALGQADFSVLSSTLAFRKNILFTNAQQCLGVSGVSINRTQLDVMGQMACVFSSSYILNSDPYVLEKLKLCPTLTEEQSSAVETVLLSGKTVYGAPENWNQTTLTTLGSLPLYLTSNFWAFFTKREKNRFLRLYIPGLKRKRTMRRKIQKLLKEARKLSKSRSLLRFRREVDESCTVGEITQIEANDESFPFNYDVNQFNACLSVQTLKDNLAAITDKATDPEYQLVILDKLHKAYPDGVGDDVLQFLGPASRSASTSDISKWNVTKIETLSALMTSYDGDWSPEQVTVIVNRYLSGNRNLDYLALNALGGINLCALSANQLNTITATSLRLADELSVSNCSTEKKQVLFSIAENAFSNQPTRQDTRADTTISPTTYQLIRTYLGGANISYVRKLSKSNISMDVQTFTELDPDVINQLTVDEVRGLLDLNLADLKLYESHPVVQAWIQRQLQSDLDKLGIGLIGGRVVTTASPTTVTVITTAGDNVTTANSTTTGAASSISSFSGLGKLLVLLGVTMATLQLIH